VAEGTSQRYRVIEPTFSIEGEGDAADALEQVLNEQSDDGYRLVAVVPVREAKEGKVSFDPVSVMVLERIDPETAA
jgi:hypothetical protein